MNTPGDRHQPTDIDTSLVECIVLVVPDAGALAGLTAALEELAEMATIRILDVVAVMRSRGTGEVTVREFDRDDSAAVLAEKPAGRLLSENDVARAAAALLPGSAGLLVVIEDRWAEALSSAAQRAGGSVIGGGRIPRTRMEAALAQPPWSFPPSGGPQPSAE
jgi:hypothetical protein